MTRCQLDQAEHLAIHLEASIVRAEAHAHGGQLIMIDDRHPQCYALQTVSQPARDHRDTGAYFRDIGSVIDP